MHFAFEHHNQVFQRVAFLRYDITWIQAPFFHPLREPGQIFVGKIGKNSARFQVGDDLLQLSDDWRAAHFLHRTQVLMHELHRVGAFAHAGSHPLD